ncbi:MAG: peptidylprolyl isomerase [Candidatus Bilamarchaeaceae archaeon]
MVEKGDFILLEVEGKDDAGRVFDSTKGEIAKQLHGKEGPLLVVYGTDKLIPGLHRAIKMMKKGEERSLNLGPKEAFGERKRNLVRIMPLSEFAKHKVEPKAGLVIHVDTDTGRLYGNIKSVNAGRVMVDFNHPIAGQSVSYRVKLIDVFSTPEEKVRSLMEYLGLEGTFTLKDGILEARWKKREGKEYEVSKAMFLITSRTKIPGIKKVDFKEE